jgi:single-stranded-DNA-specific exonuclease
MNAAGRLGYAGLVVEMLTTANSKRAQEIASYLESQNTDRQSLERKMVAQAREMIQDVDLTQFPAAVLSHRDWHPGVIGIVASRIVDLIGRPTLIIAPREGQSFASGSGRSIPGFPLHEALKACESELITHGGHAMAAGFKVSLDRIDSLREKFSQYAAEHFPERVPPPPRIVLDAELPLPALNLKFMDELNRLEPYGAENPKPKFLVARLQIQGEPRRIGKTESHLSFRVKQGSTAIRVVGFGKGERLDELMSEGGMCCLAATPVINEWQGNRSVELHLIDFQAGGDARLE